MAHSSVSSPRVLWLSADQMSAAASYLARQWGEYGYHVEAIETPSIRVSLFRVIASDGSRFTIATDTWGNCRDWESSDGERERVLEMHAKASVS